TTGSTAPELSFQLLPAEEQGGGPAVGTVVRIRGQVALGEECLNLFRRQTIPRFHRRVAGHQAEQVVEKLFPVRRLLPGHEVIDDGQQNRPGRAVPQDRRVTRQQQRTAAEILYAEPQFTQGVLVFERATGLLGRQVNRFGNQ